MIVSTFTQSTTGTKEQKSRDPLLTALRGGFPLFQVTPLDEEPLRAPLAGTNTSRDMSPGNPVPSSISNFPGPSKLFIDSLPVRKKMQPVWGRREAKDLAPIQPNIRSDPGDEFRMARPNMDKLIRTQILHDLHLTSDPGSVRSSGMKILRSNSHG